MSDGTDKLGFTQWFVNVCERHANLILSVAVLLSYIGLGSLFSSDDKWQALAIVVWFFISTPALASCLRRRD